MYLLKQIECIHGLPYQSISPELAEDVGRVVFARQMEDHNILGCDCLPYMME
jgi:hypothetical protein